MSKKMWNRIFKTKSTNKTPGISKKSSIPTPSSIITSSAVENRLSYYEEFHSCCQQQQPPLKVKTTSSGKAAPQDSAGAVKTPSKFFKVVNTFTLKRNSKENQGNQLNTRAADAIEKSATTVADDVGGVFMDKIGTPTTTQPVNTIEASEEPVSLELIPCPTCSRTFVPKTLEKHVQICEKMTVKKRKVFDSSRQRREGTELAAYPLPKNFGLPVAKTERAISPKPMQAPPAPSPKKPTEEVVKQPAQQKSITQAALKKLTSPSPTSTNLTAGGHTSVGHSTSAPKERSRPTTVPKRMQPPPAEPCPYCERCFGLKAYDRHVEWCKEKALIASIKQNNSNSQVAAKERLEARIKYRAPCLKTKRSVNRDKYSGHNDEYPDMQSSMEESHPKASSMTSSMMSSFMSDGSRHNRLNAPKQKPVIMRPQLAPSELPKNKKRSVTCESSNALRNYPVQKDVEAFKSISSNTVGRSGAATPMSDDDLEQLYEKEFQRKTASNGAKMYADSQATKLDQKMSTATTRRKKIETPFMTQEALLNAEASSSSRRHLIKERIEFFNSPSSASSNTSCRTGASVTTEQVPGCLPKNKSFIVSGLSDKYDPFLSAKRQLEELCSPSSPTDGVFSPPAISSTPTKQTTPTTPTARNKMSTSLTSTTSLTNPRRALTTVKSNFRRTSSLRAPRRSPLPPPTRSIFFPTSQKQRPTIQRGLSDEGPISSNFLKPEEYDEMPVRSVCVNDFAISNTPRVVRRDSNAAANRKNLRLHLPTARQNSKDNSPTPAAGITNSSLLKTDSLAVFLKYENEAKAVENPVINSKELKDKSNTLSKQNSGKSLILSDDASRSGEPPLGRSENIGNMGAGKIKLEPIVRPVSVKQSSPPQLSAKQPPPPTVLSPIVPKSINLNSIFDNSERLDNSEGDYINPKLINVCDNLPMEFSNDLPMSSNSSSSTTSSGGGVNDLGTEKTDHAENSAHLSSSSNSSPSPLTFKRAPSPTSNTKAAHAANSCTNSNRNSSGDGRNQLKRKLRLGRNQFLYDASPENEALDNDADDEGNNNNRSFCEPSDRRKLHQHTPSFPPTTNTVTTTPNIPPLSPFTLSTFDEFDFEEFLSSFDNDDEQFPSLFKDCREFLTNRSTFNNRFNIDKISSFRSTGEVHSNSARKYEQDVEPNLNCGENKKHGEIFISIETNQNDNDPHPKNDPLVVANPTAQVEEVDANDNKFRKIEDADVDNDDEDRRDDGHRVDGDESDDRLRMRRINLLNDFPNVRLNNAKNLIQQMHEDFQDLHGTAVADAEDEMNGNSIRQITGSSLYPVDSDEISSIECYPVHGRSSGRTGSVGDGGVVQSKHSADSAYGSLSRQSPTGDMVPHHRSSNSNRARTPTTPQDSSRKYPYQYPTTTAYKYSNLNSNDIQKYRCRNFSAGSSSSGSDNSLPPISGNNNNIHQDQSTKDLKRPFHRNPLSAENKANYNPARQSTGTASNSSSTNNLDPLTSMKVSKFCHECGSRFLLEQAKFCMDCGVRRIVLK